MDHHDADDGDLENGAEKKDVDANEHHWGKYLDSGDE